MNTRRSAAHADSVASPRQDEGASRGVVAPPAPSRAGRPRAQSRTDKGGTAKQSTGTATRAATTRSSYSAAKAPPNTGGTSLKIVLKRTQPLDPATADASVPPVITLDSTSANSTPSVGSSRSASPPPPLAHSSSPPNGRKGQRNGRDGLNRVCHHHKSQTDRPRMICINAPECRTMWCNVCVEKHYLSSTPNATFESGASFNCPVCLDTCVCAQCKRKRRGYGREPRRASLTGTGTGTGGEGAVVESKKHKREKGKKDRKGKGRAPEPSAGVDGGDEADDDDDLTSTDEEADVQKMLVDEEDGVVAVKKRASLNCAYDRANPPPAPAPPTSTAVPAPASPPPAPAPTPASTSLTVTLSVPAPTSAPVAAPPPGRKNRPQKGRRAPPRPRPSLETDTPFNYAHLIPRQPAPPTLLTAASTRPKRTKRPSTAFDDYAVDYATSSAAGLLDGAGPSGRGGSPTLLDARGTPYGPRRGGAAAAASSVFPAYPSREELQRLQAQQQKRVRRWRSGISSASSCDGMSLSDGSFDDEDEEEEMLRRASMPPEPLPVLAGLERNLGLEQASDSGDEGGEGAGRGMTFGELFGVGLLDLPASASAVVEDVKPRKRKVTWHEGPERRKRRAAAEAAKEGKEPASPVDDIKAAAEEAKDRPRPASALGVFSLPPGRDASEPLKPFSSPRLKRRATLSAPPPDPSTTKPTVPASSSSLSTPRPQSPTTDAPPPYESHFPPGTLPPPSASVIPPSPNAALFPFPSPASPTQAAARAASTAAAPIHPTVTAPPVPAPSPLSNRTEADAKLAFALLDAVRAATGMSSRSSESGDSAAGIGAALAVALTTGTSSDTDTPSPSKTSVALPLPSTTPLAASTATPLLAAEGSFVTHIDDLEAQRLEAARRLASRAATALVDPGKAFKRTVAKDQVGAQFFVAAAMSDDGADADDDDLDVGPSVSVRASSEGTRGRAASEVPIPVAAESPLLVEDLWTPASVADTSLSHSTAASTAASTATGEERDKDRDRERERGDLDLDPLGLAGLADDYAYFSVAVGSGAVTPAPASAGLELGAGVGVGMGMELDFEPEGGMKWLEEMEGGGMDGVEAF